MTEIFRKTADYEKLSGSGIGIYFEFYKLNLDVPETFSEISDLDKTFLNSGFAKIKSLPGFYTEQFTHEIEFRKDPEKLKIFVSKDLLPLLKNRAGKKDVPVNTIFAFYNTSDKTNYLLLDGIEDQFSEESFKYHSYDFYMRKGIENNKIGNYVEAIKSFDKVVEAVPDAEFAYYNRGNSYNFLQNFDKAIESYTKAIEIDRKFHLAYMNRALVRKNLGQYEQALTDIEKTVELSPAFHDGYYNKGLILHFLKRYEESNANFKKAYSLNKSNHDSLIMIAVSAQNKNDNKEAIEYSNRYISIYPKSGAAFYIRGFSHIAEGDKSRGCADLAKAKNLGYNEAEVCR
ncbi:tetratricopeptide repeat protein [Leptospira gomenensis]|nr:tetratricopeptide repeat protein [Leptospira gomenensis]